MLRSGQDQITITNVNVAGNLVFMFKVVQLFEQNRYFLSKYALMAKKSKLMQPSEKQGGSRCDPCGTPRRCKLNRNEQKKKSMRNALS
jgi:hypothetical protein